jgi:SAM-dependent methyltransferase
VRKLRKLVAKLNWEGDDSEWGAYEAFHNYSESDHRLKESFVDECVAASGAGLVWDIGCNTGQFSRIAARHARQVLAMDLDHFAVERLYRALREEGQGNILTLVQNVADPSPNWGWRNRERSDLGSRARPDLILCLALFHHVVISANIPLDEFVDWLAGLADQLVIEFVARADDKVKTLLATSRTNTRITAASGWRRPWPGITRCGGNRRWSRATVSSTGARGPDRPVSA